MPCETRLARLLVRLDPAGGAPSKSSGSAASSGWQEGPETPRPRWDPYIKHGHPNAGIVLIIQASQDPQSWKEVLEGLWRRIPLDHCS